MALTCEEVMQTLCNCVKRNELRHEARLPLQYSKLTITVNFMEQSLKRRTDLCLNAVILAIVADV